MTWIIGASTMFGYGIVLSDTCVTYTENGQTKTVDALQKAFPLGPFVVGGFAGSVYIGFQMLHHLREFLHIPESEGNCAWKVDWVAENWQPIAQEIFQKSPSEEQAAGSHLILVGAHPTEDVGIHGFARIHIAVLKSPNFQPVVQQGKFLTIESIGSGTQAYEKELKEILEDPFSMAQMEVNNQGGMGTILKSRITDRLRKNPTTGVSQHLHAFLIKRGEILGGNNDFTEWHQNGTKIEFKMPPIAQNYNDLLEILKMPRGRAVIIS